MNTLPGGEGGQRSSHSRHRSSEGVMREPPVIGEIPIWVSMGYSYEAGGDDWVESPIGLSYLFQPPSRWEELYDRAADTATWEYVVLHGSLELRPTAETYSWIDTGGAA